MKLNATLSWHVIFCFCCKTIDRESSKTIFRIIYLILFLWISIKYEYIFLQRLTTVFANVNEFIINSICIYIFFLQIKDEVLYFCSVTLMANFCQQSSHMPCSATHWWPSCLEWPRSRAPTCSAMCKSLHFIRHLGAFPHQINCNHVPLDTCIYYFIELRFCVTGC